MRALVFTPNNENAGQLAIAIPLYPDEMDQIDAVDGYKIAFMVTPPKPLAYVVDIGDANPQVISAHFLEDRVTFLGDL